MEKKKKPFVRILAIIGICIMLGLIVLSFVAALSDWEDREKIFIITAGGTVVIPILIYGVLLYSKKKEENKE